MIIDAFELDITKCEFECVLNGFIIDMAKLLDADWLRGVKFFR